MMTNQNNPTLLAQAKAFADEDPHMLPLLSNISALLMETLPDINWAGFYIADDSRLTLGPFQGRPACIHIAKGKGVCGTAFADNRQVLVENVHAFPGHIACDSASLSEIVTPIHDAAENVAAVLDIDSTTLSRFDENDASALKDLCDFLSETVIWPMDVETLTKKSRSYRGYDHSVRISRDQLVHYVDITRFCPSSVNRQPLKYYLAYNEEDVRKVQGETKWAKALPELTLPHPGKEPTAFVVICQDTTIDQNLSRFQRDIGIVAQTILLAATEDGLGGCMIGNINAGSLSATIGLPANIHPILVVALGKPDETIILTDVTDSTNYYRDENDIHYVPKRSLADELLN